MLDVLNLSFFNQHWTSGNISTEETERSVLPDIFQNLDNRQIQFLVGARRLGKSVALKQTIKHLIEHKKINPRQILFYEFSNGQNESLMWQIWEYYTTQIADVNQKIYLCLDEIQYVKNFENVIKLWYDQVSNLKIIVTGSLSLSYKRKMNESLAGRIIITHFYPLSFEEFLILRNLPELELFKKLSKSTDYLIQHDLSQKMNPLFRRFLETGRYPQIITDKLEPKSYLESVLNQSISVDSSLYFSIHKPVNLRNLFNYLQKNNGMEVNISKLASVSGLDRETVKNYLNCLELLGLIYELNKTSQQIQDNSNNFKIYTCSTWTLNYSQNSIDNYGQIAESYFLERQYQNKQSVFYYRNRSAEIDFISLENKEALEVKFKLDIQAKDITNLAKLALKINLKPVLISMFPHKTNQMENRLLMLA